MQSPIETFHTAPHRTQKLLFHTIHASQLHSSQRGFFLKSAIKKRINRKQPKINPKSLNCEKSLSLGEVENWTESSELEYSSKDKSDIADQQRRSTQDILHSPTISS